MHRTVVLNVVGLTPGLLGPSMPALTKWAGEGSIARIRSAFPAVTCSAQADYLTGRLPSDHGIVGNGWYSREDAEVKFWKQSNLLVQAPKVYETARAADPTFTCANLFWWFNMYSSADYTVTPRPMYPADGRKVPDVYTRPSSLRDELNKLVIHHSLGSPFVVHDRIVSLNTIVLYRSTHRNPIYCPRPTSGKIRA